MKEYEMSKKMFENETDVYKINKVCKNKLVKIVMNANTDVPVQMRTPQSSVEYTSIHRYLTLELLKDHMKGILSNELKAFVRCVLIVLQKEAKPLMPTY